jgi:hypothetical protein
LGIDQRKDESSRVFIRGEGISNSQPRQCRRHDIRATLHVSWWQYTRSYKQQRSVHAFEKSRFNRLWKVLSD